MKKKKDVEYRMKKLDDLLSSYFGRGLIIVSSYLRVNSIVFFSESPILRLFKEKKTKHAYKIPYKNRWTGR